MSSPKAPHIPKHLIQVYTLGRFEVCIDDIFIDSKSWGRGKTIQLFQFLITNRDHGIHKEQIIDRLWPDMDYDSGDRDFKVAMHGILKVLEPDRKKREEPKVISRQGLIYQLVADKFWIDVDYFEENVSAGNLELNEDSNNAIRFYQKALEMYKGIYLPRWIYEDWTTSERERLQILAMGAYINCAEAYLEENPSETIRLTQQALKLDNAWEDAYRIQIEAFIKTRNRPQALRTFKKCIEVLEEEFGIEPLPTTGALLKNL